MVMDLVRLRAEQEAGERRRLAREAYQRIRQFLVDHDVHFNGAGEVGLDDVAQAWSVAHTDPEIEQANRTTISGVAQILRDYRQIRCQVHGETGKATTAPLPLAEHLDLDPALDVKKCMDHLAKQRADACIQALIEEGCPPSQLFASWDGMGGHVRVDCIDCPRNRTCPLLP